MKANFLFERLPSGRELFLIFITCLVLINLWSVLNFLRVIPSLILYLKISEIIGIGAYTLAFALLESIGVLLFLLVMIIILPKRLFGDKVVVKSAAFIWSIAIWALSFHYLYILIPKWKDIYRYVCQILGCNFTDSLIIQVEYFLFVILWMSICILILIFSLSFVSRSDRGASAINNIIQKTVGLAIVYLFVDAVSVIIVVVRLFT